jgi:hypothetical protein
MFQQQAGDAKCSVGKTSFITGTIKRDRIGVIDNVGCVICVASSPFEQRDRIGEIAVFQRLKGVLITHATAVSAGLLSLSGLKMFLGPPLETGFLLCAIDAALF